MTPAGPKMPQLPDLDEFPYVPQEEDSLGCVPACIEMVCEYLGLLKDREEIESEVGYSPDQGTPFDNVGLLSRVHALPIGSVDEATDKLECGLPIIANLYIADAKVLGYFGEEASLRAVVLVGIETNTVLFVDPLSLVQLGTADATRCDLTDFEYAWLGGWVLTALPSSPP
jgi:hypothetical protein